MEELSSQPVQFFLYLLSKAETPDDAISALTVLPKRHRDLSAVVCLPSYEKSIIPSAFKKYLSPEEGHLIPYFSSDKLYILNNEVVSDMYSSGERQIRIDYSLMLDTNIASYIDKLVRLQPVGTVQEKLISLIDNLLYDDLNFDHLFYMIENVKTVRRQIIKNHSNRLHFWKSLNKKFRQNLTSLQIFSSIDCRLYRDTRRIVPRYSYRQAVRAAINFSYDFYASEIGRPHIHQFLLVQRLLLLQLIGMVRIQLGSNKNAKNKMSEYLSFVNDVVGAYFDRETIVAHKYFSNRKNLPILQKIQKGVGKTRLLKKLDNIAWDMAAPRFMEQLMGALNEGDCFIPFFLTFDSRLKEMIRAYEVKGVVYTQKSGFFAPIPKTDTREYLTEHGCADEISHFFSHPIRSERLSRDTPTLGMVHKLIKNEFRRLRSVV